MLILGLDPSQSAGWALFEVESPLSSMRAGALKAEADKGAHLTIKAASLGPKLIKLIKHERPDFVAIEAPPQTGYGGAKPSKLKFMGEELPGDVPAGGITGLKSVISTNDCATALATVVQCYGIPYVLLQDSSWRASAYGFGRRAGWARPQWKKHARALCAQHRISVTNDDAAEACWIAFAGAGTPEFRMLKSGRAA